MEAAKLPIASEINLNVFNEQDNPYATCYIDSNNDLYQINFYKKNDAIYINCHDTSKEEDIIYSYELSLEEVKQTNVFKTFDQILNFFKGINDGINNYSLEKKGDTVLLKITINDHSRMNLILVREMNSLKDVISQMKNLIKENENLKSRVSKLEEENEKMKLNYFYNSFDTQAYKLENLFENLKLNKDSNIINNKYDLRLINQGIKFLFNKTITNLKIFYEYKDDFDPQFYADISSQLNFYIIIILTKDNRKFGGLFNKSLNKNNQIINDQLQNNDIYEYNQINYNNHIQQQQINNNNSNNNIIFNSSSNLNEYFVFSLDYYKLYYCDKTNTNVQNVPNFTVIFEQNRQCIYGTEACPNGNLANSQSLEMSQRSIQINPYMGKKMRRQIQMNPNMGNQKNNFQDNLYKLSGKNEFNVKYFEIVEIEMNMSN